MGFNYIPTIDIHHHANEQINRRIDHINNNKHAIVTKEKGRKVKENNFCLLYTSPSPRDRQKSRMPSSA